GEEEVPVDVESSEVAGVQPACGVEPLGGHTVGVGADHALTTDADPPDDVRGAPPALRIDHLQFHPHRPACRSGRMTSAKRGCGDLAGRLGHAVALYHDHPGLRGYL